MQMFTGYNLGCREHLLDLGMPYRHECVMWVRCSRGAEDLGISIVSDLEQLLVPYPHHRG